MATVVAAALFVTTIGTGRVMGASVAIVPLDQQPTAIDAQLAVTPSVRTLHVGVSGVITGELVTADLTGDGDTEVLFPTSGGLYVLSGAEVILHIPTSSAVTRITLVDDLSGNGAPEVVLVVSDVFFPNVRTYDTATGEKLWDYVPAQEVFVDNLMWTEQQTQTYDVETVDLNSDGALDIAVTSGYLVHAIDGRSGDRLWTFEALDNVWKVEEVPDIDGDGVADLVVGGQDGILHALSGGDGKRIWEKALVESYAPLDEDGERKKSVDRSVFDILSVDNGSGPEAIVTAEDGMVRLIDLDDGTVVWSTQVLEYVDAMLSTYYRAKSNKATRPGDFNFFNLKLHPVPNAPSDRLSLVVSAYLGRAAMQSLEPRGAGLFMLDPSTGDIVWENRTVKLAESAELEFVTRDARPVIITPAENSKAVSVVDGTVVEAGISPLGVPGRRSGGWFYVEFADDDFTAASRSGQMAGRWDGIDWTAAPPGPATAVRGDFTGDVTTDILVYSSTISDRDQYRRPRTRFVYVVDGATQENVWTYEMQEDKFDLTGGIADIQPAPDLDGDGKQDIIGFTQPIDAWHNEGERRYEGSGVVALSGADGTVLLNQPIVSESYYGDWEALLTDPEEVERRVLAQIGDEFARQLDQEWQGQETNLRDEFERNLSQKWDEFIANQEPVIEEQVQEQANDLELQRRQEQELAGESSSGSGGATEAQQAEFDALLQKDIDRLQNLGVDESIISQFADGKRSDFEAATAGATTDPGDGFGAEFEGELQNELLAFQDQRRAELRAELEGTRPTVEDGWRDDFDHTVMLERSAFEATRWLDFESGELGAQVEQWRQQLQNEEWNRRIDKRISYLGALRVPGLGTGMALIAANRQDVFIIDIEGELLWTRTFNSGNYQTPFGDVDSEAMAFPTTVEQFGDLSPLRVAGDLNADGIDDLLMVGREGTRPMLSVLDGGSLEFEPGPLKALPELPPDRSQAMTTDDTNGDGFDDIFFIEWRENQPGRAVLVSGVSGDALLELDPFEPNSRTLESTGDLDGDGTPDILSYEMWAEGHEGPRLRVLAGDTGDVIWEYSGFKESFLFNETRSGFQVMPAAAISDVSGDGIDDLAITRHTTFQSGAQLVVVDVARDEVIAEVVLEEIDERRKQEARWHPGLAVTEAGDLNGDGSPEVALVTATGREAERKQYGVFVVDVARKRAIADFRVSGSKFIKLDAARGGTEGGLALTGSSGEIYLLDVANRLHISAPATGGSPLEVSWSGVAPGSFNQVIVGGLEMARTNLDSASVPLTAGDHQVTVRSLDEYGRGVYTTLPVNINKSSSIVFWTILFTTVLTAGAFWLPASMFVQRLRRRAASNG